MKEIKVTDVSIKSAGRPCTLVKVETDAGITGFGEVLSSLMDLAVAVEDIKAYLIGKDALKIEHHWQGLYRGAFLRGGQVWVSALSGIEIALWDILGKSLEVPVWQLLGGKVREKIRMYGHFGGNTLEECAENAKKTLQQRDLTALKFTPFKETLPQDSPEVISEAAKKMQAVREAVGLSVDIAIDCHGRLSPMMAIQMAEAMEKYRPFFFEEPCLPDNVDSMAQIARSTSIPIATGERLCTTFGFRELLEKQAAAILQPDPILSGGIFQLRKIAAMAETYYAAVAPHNPFGPVATAVCLQLAACIPNFLIQEHTQSGLGEGVLREPFVVKDGYIAVPEKPGLGIEVDETALQEGPIGPGRLSLGQHEDGSWADV